MEIEVGAELTLLNPEQAIVRYISKKRYENNRQNGMRIKK